MGNIPRLRFVDEAKAVSSEAQLTEAPLVPAEAATSEISSEVEAKLSELAKLTEFAYDQVRRSESDALNIRLVTLDKLVEERRLRGATQGVEPLPEPWADSVDGAALLDELSAVFRRHVIATDESTAAAVLWVPFAHTHNCWTHSPSLQITAPTPDAGKTTALKFITLVVPNPVPASNISTAAVFRVISKINPTLLIDEADAFFKEKPDLRSILDSGHDREVAYVWRCDGEDFEPKKFSTWCPKVIAGIGKLHQTLESRCIKIELQRKGRTESVEQLPRGNNELFDRLQRMCVRWAKDNAVMLQDAKPQLPSELNNRAADNWRPLIAIADAAGGQWPALVRSAAIKITAANTDDTYGILLLGDLRKLFAEEAAGGGKNLATTEIIGELSKMEDRPWAEFTKTGKPITPGGLARLLRPFKIFPRTVYQKWGGGRASGYDPDWFVDAFKRYLDPTTEQHERAEAEKENQDPPDREAPVPAARNTREQRQAKIAQDRAKMRKASRLS